VIRDIVYGKDSSGVKTIEGHDFEENMCAVVIPGILTE
jgi:hypothetical protein